jgi:RNase adaptor protein for sRNA GlmZ degradation
MITVRIHSFGYRFSGIPPDDRGNGGGFVFDCRCLPNPGALAQFAPMTGLDAPVRAWLEERDGVHAFARDAAAMAMRAVEAYGQRGYTDLMVSFGCTGGRHRSVYCAERLAAHLRAAGVDVVLRHCEASSW